MVSKSKTREPIDLNVPYLVYHITSPLSKSNGYVGITKLKSVEERLEKHFQHMVEDLRQLERGKIHRLRTVLKALNKYGRDNITIKQIDSCIGIVAAGELEKKYIAELDTFKNGWNETTGGEGQPSFSPDEHTRAKISKANTGRKRTADAVEDNRKRGLQRAESMKHNQPPKKTKPCTIDGIEFKSKQEAMMHFGVNQSQLEKMISSGISSILDSSSVEVYGVRYKNKAEAYSALGWNKQNYYNYLMYGAPTKPKDIPRGVCIDGVRYSSIKEASRVLGCSTASAMYLASGGKESSRRFPTEVTLFGKTYKTKQDACYDLGITKLPLEALLDGKKIPRTWALYRYENLYFSAENSFKRLTGLSSWYFREYLENGKIEDVYDQHIKYDMKTGQKL